ncbi:MAG: hypothetical protein IPI52_09415 [Bacteroidetes bacterium]|nr:hypothetical protein [Bacteroidota bacterium]MBL0078512.1 hypothetical protein [Bacteroidota bacterium]MBP7256008.1 hypothetical protein [Chitinophagales bacterium]
MRKLLFVLPLLFLIFACKKEKNIVFSDLERAIENPKNNEISDADIAELLKLSDTTTLESIEDLEYRQFKIGKIFSAYHDKRGTFPTLYKAITELVTKSLDQFEDGEKAEYLAFIFGKSYLMNLYAHLIDAKVEYHWKEFYKLALNDDISIIHTIFTSINAHLCVDLSKALKGANYKLENKDDYFLYGDILVTSLDSASSYLQQNYNYDPSFALGGFQLGDFVDAIFGDGITTYLGFQLLRSQAWENGLYLQNPSLEKNILNKLRNDFFGKEDLFKTLKENGVI